MKIKNNFNIDFSDNFLKIYVKSPETKNFRIIKSKPCRSYRDQHFEKNFKETPIKFYKNLKNSLKNLKKLS